MQLKSIGLSALSSAIFVFSACGTSETTANRPAANNSNTANIVVSNLTNANKTNVVSNTPVNSSNSSNVNKNSSSTATDSGEADEISGELQVGKTDSVICISARKAAIMPVIVFRTTPKPDAPF